MVCLCSSLFFLGLYQFNNKYSQNTIQAANGILALSEEELQKSPVRFLVSGWAFYPDALLTPEEIQDESQYMRYLSIGEPVSYTHLDVYKRQLQKIMPGWGTACPPAILC